MRYIAKTAITEIVGNANLTPLTGYISAQLKAVPAMHPSYSGLDKNIKPSLISQLVIEQQGLCCYCTQRLEEGQFHVEHLLPQSCYKNEEVEYFNLFLSCGSHKEKKHHCGHYKDEYPIAKMISYHNPKTGIKCENHFKYNLLGEILPKEGFENSKKNFESYALLNAFTKQLVGIIEVLNLNCEELKAKRKSVLDTIMALPYDANAFSTLLTKYRTIDATGKLEALCQVAMYFLELRLSKAK